MIKTDKKFEALKIVDTTVKLTDDEIEQAIQNTVCPRCGGQVVKRHNGTLFSTTTWEDRMIVECPNCGYRKNITIKKTVEKNEDKVR